MLDYAFTALGLHNVMLTIHEYNLAGRRAYEKAGFKEIGRRRQCRWLNGGSGTRSTWTASPPSSRARVRRAIFVPDEPRP